MSSPYSVEKLLELSILAVRKARDKVFSDVGNLNKDYTYDLKFQKEIKASVDVALEKEILDILTPTGLSILSEEIGIVKSGTSELYFVVDPLDGTFNYIKDSGPYAISIALWRGNNPVFGVIFDLNNNKLAWGGKGIGSFYDSSKINVSNINNKKIASIFTGFPSRLKLDSKNEHSFFDLVSSYSKVRMIGSAAISLLNVARGSADIYVEKNIMHWDVAAGIAIVEGAGGRVKYEAGSIDHSLNVYASNGLILE